jgi:preprotein translocase subunit SecE
LVSLGILVVVIFVGWVIYMIDQLISIPLKLSQVKRK